MVLRKIGGFRPILSVLLLLMFLQFFYPVAAQEVTGVYLKVGDWAEYSFKGTKAYIPYGSGGNLRITVVNMSDPDNILINISRGDDVLNVSIPAGFYILNNYTLMNDMYTCPLKNTSRSLIKEHWTPEYLKNDTQYYYDVERECVVLSYSTMEVIDEDLYNISVTWVWDKQTGILLNNSVYFNNTETYYLSGYFEQALTSTSIWSITAEVGIPGFEPAVLFAAVIIGIIAVLTRGTAVEARGGSRRSGRWYKP